MTWGAIGGSAIGAVGGMLGSKMAAGNKFGGGMDYANKAARQPMLDTLKDINNVYAQPAVNPLMQQGFDAASAMPTTLQQYLDYGNQMMGTGGTAMQGMLGGAQGLMGFDPRQYNASFQAGGAVGPQYDQTAFNQMMGNAGGVINPMLQSIAAMNQRTLGENLMPQMAGNAIASGNTTSSKWGTNNAVLQRGMMDANANAASNLWSQMGQQAAGVGAQYGMSAADAQNRAMLQNTNLSNTLGYEQSGRNMAAALEAMRAGTGAYGDIVSRASPYWQGTMQMQANMPQFLTDLGMMQRNAPADWLNMKQNAIGVVGNFGTGGAAGANGANPSLISDVGKGIGAGMQLGSLFGGPSSSPPPNTAGSNPNWYLNGYGP